METSLRKMGNSTGVILPRAILGQAGLATGAAMDVTVEGEKLVLTPVRRHVRAGWSDAAAALAEAGDSEADDWRGFANEDDSNLLW